jgi:hypothetical protein
LTKSLQNDVSSLKTENQLLRDELNTLKWTDVLRDSQKLLVKSYREFERQFGGKTVLAGLRLKKQSMVRSSEKSHLKFEVCFDFFHHIRWFLILLAHQADPALAPLVSDRVVHEAMELISIRHFHKFSVWSQKTCGNLNVRLL